MKVWEKFFEYAYEKDKFDIVGEWVITKCKAPHTYGFKTLKWYGPKLDTGVDATYTLTKIDENTTKWNRDRDTYNKEGQFEVQFLEDENRLEEMYQNAVKNYLETGNTGFTLQTPVDLHPKGCLQTLKVIECLYNWLWLFSVCQARLACDSNRYHPNREMFNLKSYIKV